MKILFFGLSITSSWGNGHATTYRALLKALEERGHELQFYEQDVPWYAAHRDLPEPSFVSTTLYEDLSDLLPLLHSHRDADAIVIGSFVSGAVALTEWLNEHFRVPLIFYDIDTPVTVTELAKNDCFYLTRESVRIYDLYLSFAGGDVVRRLTDEFGARTVRPLYCSVDPSLYFPDNADNTYDLGYLGTYSADRQPALNRLLSEPARQLPNYRFVVAGSQYPKSVSWPANVEQFEHLPPSQHRRFYNSQRFTLNVTRADMIANGFSPSVRLFEAAACAVPIISDRWEGLEEFFVPGVDILVADDTRQCMDILRALSEAESKLIGESARRRVLTEHTAARRAAQFEEYVHDVGVPAARS